MNAAPPSWTTALTRRVLALLPGPEAGRWSVYAIPTPAKPGLHRGGHDDLAALRAELVDAYRDPNVTDITVIVLYDTKEPRR